MARFRWWTQWSVNVGPTKAVTVTVMVRRCVSGLLVPVTVSVNVVGATEELTEILSIEVPVGVDAVRLTGFGTNMVRTPVGGVDVARFTLPVKPFWPMRVMVEAPVEPAEMLSEAGLAAIVKSVTVIMAEPVLVP